MRRVLFISFTGLLVGGCAGPDVIRAPTEAPPAASLSISAAAVSTTSNVSTAGILADAIDRLVPALGPPGVALGAPLRQLRDGGLSATLIDAVQRQLATIAKSLSPETTPDADALAFALGALKATTVK
jgi:hypothetical protein